MSSRAHRAKEGIPPAKDNELLGVYAVERQDDASALALAFTTATAGFTYMIAAVLFIPRFYAPHQCFTNATCNCSLKGKSCDLLSWLHFGIPSVPIIIMGFLVLGTAATRLRSVHLQRLEKVLAKDMNPAPSFHTDSGIVWRAADHLFKPPRVRVVFAIIAMLMYAVLYASIILFTIVMTTFGHGESRYWWEAIYLTVETLFLAGLVVPLFDPHFKL